MAQAQLEAALVPDREAADAGARQLMADLVGFHRREAKPAWWAFFDRQERGADELRDDDECLGGCVAAADGWVGREKRSLTFRYRYPEQETKLREGAAVHVAATGEAAGTILSHRRGGARRRAQARQGEGELPREVSLIPGGPISTDALRSAVWTAAADMAKAATRSRTSGAPAPRRRAEGRPPGAPISRPRTATIRRGCSAAPSAPSTRSIAPGS